MKFLWLHGAGTNNRIFELQTAALRSELGDGHTYEFVEGVVVCDMFPTIEALAVPKEKYFKYYEEGSQSSFLKALVDMERYVLSEGPFDALLAFSQGSTVGAGFALRMEKQSLTPFTCAIFISGAVPDDENTNNSVNQDKAPKISMPTTHIWGAGEANAAIPKALYDLCMPEGRSLLVFGGGHEVPGARNSTALIGSARLIRRMVSYVQDTSSSKVQPIQPLP